MITVIPGVTMQEPKKYTAREAMHWMIDHQGEQMVLIEPVDGARLYLYKFTNLRFGGSLNGFGWAEVGSDFLSDKLSATIYVRTEYDAWQAEIKAGEKKAKEDARKLALDAYWNAETVKEQQAAEKILESFEAEKAKDSEPREGESLADYAMRLTIRGNKEIRGEVDAWQRWIESYVRREIKKAICGTVDVTVREAARATGERLSSAITELLERVAKLEAR